MTERNEASQAQIIAANPNASTWLSANAGSGKTRVLTDRVARLLLQGVPPQRILCLTYTKAAASEMQNRLFKRLGGWAMLDDAALIESLNELGVTANGDLDRARILFARAIETPGGLKIQTIHSFCASLLRQFPLESGVSPQFRELDELGQTSLIDGVLEALAESHGTALERVGRIYASGSLTDLAKSIAGRSDAFTLTETEVFESFGVALGTTFKDAYSLAITDGDLEFLASLPELLSTSDKLTDQKLGDALANLGALNETSQLDRLSRALLTGPTAKVPHSAKVGSLPTKAFREGAFAPFASQFEDIMRQVEAAAALLRQLEAADKTACLQIFAQAFLPAYAEAKSAGGLLDFDDLIAKANALLSNVDMAWILYRLDGGIDHILVDEAQDTSPAQWSVIKALTEEMTAGQGAREVERTLFVVGDKKQSIYSFQGADADGFEEMRDAFCAALADGQGMHARSLLHSFRSSPAVLNAVDHVFQDEAGYGLGDGVKHKAFHGGMPGRVDLWDLERPEESPDDPPWYDPVDRVSERSPRVRLAGKIADHVAELLKTGTIQGENEEFRRVRGGDILILVRGRGALFDAIIRASKARDLPIAGADRLRVNAELAVRDLLALLAFVALPEDDLSLAAALRSPLFGWSEQDLYRLAQPRPKGQRLWTAFREKQESHPKDYERLIELRRRADVLRPYEMLERVLTEMEGRRALIERLGYEAEDGINELLTQALAYESVDVPSLTGFLTRVQAEDVQIKRQADTSAELIRVMTVHGAKGLEAPIVILPDTVHTPQGQRDSFIVPRDGGAVWNVSKASAPESLLAIKEGTKRAAEDEDNRLLYVAMTRAAQWLIVAGASGEKSVENSWWQRIEAGMQSAGAIRVKANDREFLRLESGEWSTGGVDEQASSEIGPKTENTSFLNDALPAETVKNIITPSNLGGAKVLFFDGSGQDGENARARGTHVHRLLEKLPNLPRDTWTNEAVRMTALPEVEAEEILGEASRVIDSAPDLFDETALEEVVLTARHPGSDGVIVGTVDRLLVTPDSVLIADFKTNQHIPPLPEETPDGILRQMGAYLIAAEQIWIDKEIKLEVIWTRTAERMVLPHAIVRKAFINTPTS